MIPDFPRTFSSTTMKKIATLLLLIASAWFTNDQAAQAQTTDRQEMLRALKSIDTNIVRYFPRWRICEPDIQAKVYQTFLLFGYPKDSLDMQDIVVTAAPKVDSYEPYTLLLIESGSQSMVASEIDANMDRLAEVINGAIIFSGPEKGLTTLDGKRTYCYVDIPTETPLSPVQQREITNFLEPTDVDHSVSLSVFEQKVKIGNSGFWLRSILGTDEVGYHFWSAGEAKVVLQRPLYENADGATRRAIPYLINARLGGGYRLKSGLEDQKTIFEFVPSRQLNTGPGGKLVGGLDFHMPFHPQFGISANIELPFQGLDGVQIDSGTYATYGAAPGALFTERQDVASLIDDRIVPVLRSTGQATLFYHWWLDPERPENYFRFDLGISYAEVREAAVYHKQNEGGLFMTMEGVDGLRTFKPSEFGDWMYLKAEYRSQAVWPFGVSLQYSNQILLGRAYIPLFGQWLYLEGKYATPLRHIRPFERRNFFMISPILRLTI